MRRRETRRARPRGRNRARRWRPRRGWCWWFPRWSWTTRGDGETRRGCVDASSTCPPLVQGGHRGNRDARRDAGREAARAPSAPPSKARAATPCPRASSMRRGLETGDPARLRRAVGCGARRGVTSTKSRRRFGHQPSLVASVIVSMSHERRCCRLSLLNTRRGHSFGVFQTRRCSARHHSSARHRTLSSRVRHARGARGRDDARWLARASSRRIHPAALPLATSGLARPRHRRRG